jgi:hypothetical protein
MKIEDLGDIRPTEQNWRLVNSGSLAEELAEYLMLTGIKIGSGDLSMAMKALGLILAVNGEDGVQVPPGEAWGSGSSEVAQWIETHGEQVFLREHVEESRCPKCGLPRYRLRKRPGPVSAAWWHTRDDSEWGYMRRCWNPDMLAALADDDIEAAEQYLASRKGG